MIFSLKAFSSVTVNHSIPVHLFLLEHAVQHSLSWLNVKYSYECFSVLETSRHPPPPTNSNLQSLWFSSASLVS